MDNAILEAIRFIVGFAVGFFCVMVFLLLRK